MVIRKIWAFSQYQNLNFHEIKWRMRMPTIFHVKGSSYRLKPSQLFPVWYMSATLPKVTAGHHFRSKVIEHKLYISPAVEVFYCAVCLESIVNAPWFRWERKTIKLKNPMLSPRWHMPEWMVMLPGRWHTVKGLRSSQIDMRLLKCTMILNFEVFDFFTKIMYIIPFIF